jgi:hypothetical protein
MIAKALKEEAQLISEVREAEAVAVAEANRALADEVRWPCIDVHTRDTQSSRCHHEGFSRLVPVTCRVCVYRGLCPLCQVRAVRQVAPKAAVDRVRSDNRKRRDEVKEESAKHAEQIAAERAEEQLRKVRCCLPDGDVLFCSVLFCSVLFCSVMFCSVLFCSVPASRCCLC